jgi:hypothetical protein
LLFLNPVAPPPTSSRRATTWRRHPNHARGRRSAIKVAEADEIEADEPFEALPASAWKLVEDLERMLASYAEIDLTDQPQERVMERAGI